MLGIGMEVYVHGHRQEATGHGIIHGLFMYKGTALWAVVDMGNGLYVTTEAECIEVIE